MPTKNELREMNKTTQNPEEAFERFIDTLTQLPPGVPKNPNCSWCNWRRGDAIGNISMCTYHGAFQARLRGSPWRA
jgi:hypothetical protein